NLGAAAGNGIETGIAQARNRVMQRDAAHFRNVCNLRRGKTMAPDIELCLDGAEKIFVPFDLEIGMQSALKKHASAAEIDRFLNLAEDRFARKNVAFLVAERTIEGAEAAILRAEIRVVDIAVNDVRDDTIGVVLAANGVG